MKTSVIMERTFNGQTIRQNSKTGFLNVNDLYEAYLSQNPSTIKRIQSYFNLQQTEEFADVLRESLLDQQNLNSKDSSDLIVPSTSQIKVLETKRGKNGGTWVHPYLFLDFAMWLSPHFKLWAMSIVEDKLIQLRNEAGNRFKEMASALKASGATSPRDYMRENNLINKLVFGIATKEQRNKATDEQLELLNKLQKFNAKLIEKGKSYTLREKECINFVNFYNEIIK